MTDEQADNFEKRYVERLRAVDLGNGDIALEPKSEFEAVCDFCGAVSVPLQSHDAENIELFPGHVSEGSWAGCDPCSNFIHRGDRKALQDRAIEEYSKTLLPYDEAKFIVTHAHDAFWRAHKPRAGV